MPSQPSRLRHKKTVLVLLGLVGLMIWSSSARAQPAAAKTGDRIVSPPPPADLQQIEHLYIPESQLSTVFKRDNVRALLTKSEFAALVQRARDAEKNAPFEQLPLLLSAADYHCQISDENLLAEVEIRLTASRPHGEVDLDVTGWNVLSVKLGGAPATVARMGKELNTLRLFVPESGNQMLTLQLSAPFHAAGKDRLVRVGLPTAATGMFHVSLPAGKFLRINGVDPGRSGPPEEAADSQLPIGGLKQLTLMVTDRQQSSPADRLAFASTAYGVRVLPGETTWSAQTELQIFGQKIDRLVCRVPQALEITKVDSEGLESWELMDEPDHPGRVTITLKYRQPVEGRQSVLLQGVLASTPGEPWQVPDLSIAQVTSHTGMILVGHPANVRLQPIEIQGARAVPQPSAASARITGQQAGREMEQMAFSVWQENFVLKFVTALKQQQVQAALTSLLQVDDPGLKLGVTVSLQTRERPLFDARVRIPAEYRISTATRDGDPIAWDIVPTEAGINEFRFSLDPPLLPGKSTTLMLQSQAVPEGWPVRQTPLLVSIPEVQLPQAGMIEALYGISAPDDLELVPQELVGLDPAYQQDLQTLNAKLRPFGAQIRLGFTYQDTAFQGQMQISRKPTLFTAETLSYFRVDRQTVLTALESRLALSGGGIRELNVQLSESAGENIRFRLTRMPVVASPEAVVPQPEGPVQIVEQIPGEVTNGFRSWILKFDRYLQGTAILSTDVQLPRGGQAQFSPVQIIFPQANAQSGYLAIEGPSDQQVQVSAQTADGSPLPAVDPVDIPIGRYRPAERVVAGFQTVRPDWKVSVTTIPFNHSPIPSAVGHSAQLVSAWNATSTLQHAASYRFTAYGMQSLLVELPTTAELWSTVLDGKVVEARKVGGKIQLPLAGLEPQTEHTLQIVYETPTDNETPTGQLRAEPPRISAISGNGEEQPLAILDQQWDLYYPRETILIGSTGEFRPADFVWTDTVFNRLREHLSSLSSRHLKRMGLFLLVLGIVFCGLAQLARGCCGVRLGPWGATLLIMVMFVILFVSLLPRVQQSREASRSTAAKNAVRQRILEGVNTMADRDEERKKLASPPVAAVPESAPMPQKSQAPTPQVGTPIGQAGIATGNIVAPPASEKQKSVYATGGLLSMPISLEIPGNSFMRRFHYRGNAASSEPAGLHVRYASRATGLLLIVAIALGTALLGWWLRWAPRTLRFLFTFLTLAIPLAIVGLVPMLWVMVLQGVLAGGIVVLLGWGIVHCGCLRGTSEGPLRRWCRRWGCAALLLAGFFCLSPGLSARAEEMPVSSVAPSPAEPAPYVIVPYSSLSTIDAASRVYVPAPLFQRLWKAAHPEDLNPADSSIPFTVAEGMIQVALVPHEEAYQARLQFRWVVVNFKEEPQSVPLPVKSPGLRNPRLDGKPGTLVSLKEGTIGVLVPTQGVHIVDAELILPEAFQIQEGRLVLETLPVPAGELIFEIPSAAETLSLTGATPERPIISVRKEVEEARTLFHIPLDRGGKFTLHWRESSAPQSAEHRMQLDAAVLALIEDAGIRVNYAFDLKVRQGSVRELLFDLPPELALRQVEGKDVTGWESQSENENKHVKVIFGRPVSDQTRFQIDLYQPHKLLEMSEPVTIGMLVPQGVERVSGLLAVNAPDHLRVRMVEAKSLQQVDVSQFKPAAVPHGSGPTPQLAYRFLSDPFTLQLEVSRRDAETRGNADYGVQIGRRKTTIASRIVLNLTGVPQRLIEVELPKGYLTMDVICAQASDWYTITEQERSRLILEFDQPRTGTVEIGLEGHVARNPQEETLTVQVPAPLHVDRMTSQLGVWSDEVYQPVLVESGRWRTVSTPELSPAIRKLRSSQALFAFQTTEPTSPLQFQLQRAVAEIEGDAGILIVAGEATVDYGLTLRWNIAHAAADQFTFTVPSWLGHLDFTGAGIRQALSQPVDKDRTRWRVSLIDPVRGQYLLTAAATIASPVDQTIQTPRLEFEHALATGEYQPLPAQRQFAVFVNLSQNQLSPADPAQFESVTADQLPLAMPPQLVQQAMDIVRVRADKIPAWNMQRMERVGSSQAVIPSCTLTTVLQMDGSWRTQAVFGVRNRGQQFLALQLPTDAHILSVFVRGEPGRTVLTKLGEETIHLIALPQTSIADLSFEVTLMCAGMLPDRLRERFSFVPQSVHLPAVRVVTPKESVEFGVAVAQTVWNVFVPDELDATPVEKNGSTNVTYHRQSGRIAARLQVINRLRGDIAEMKRIAIGAEKYSAAQRIQAKNNLKELHARLLSEQGFSPSDSFGVSDKVDKRYRLESSQALSETTDAIQELERSNPVQDESARRTQGMPGQGNRAYINRNNTILLEANVRPGANSRQQLDEETFNFFAQESEQRGNMAGKKSSEEQAARSQLRQQLQSQSVVSESLSKRSSGSAPNASQGVGMGFRITPSPSQQSNTFGGLEPDDVFNRPAETGAMGGLGGAARIQAPQRDADGDKTPQGSSPENLGVASVPSNGRGLSVAMTLPESGQELSFDKPGGDPMLTLAIRPKRTWALLAGGVWGLVCLLLGLWLLPKFFRQAEGRAAWMAVCVPVMLFGATAVLLFPESLIGGLGFLLFCLAGVTRILLPSVTSPPAQPTRGTPTHH